MTVISMALLVKAAFVIGGPAGHWTGAIGDPADSMQYLAWIREGAFHFQELSQNAAGEGIDLSDSTDLEEFQQEVIDALEQICL